MLVAPLFAGDEGRDVILPPGEWHDFWTGHKVNGGLALRIASSTKDIPVFVKAGSLVPMAAVGASSEEPESRDLTVRIYGDGHLSWQMDPASNAKLELSWNATTQSGEILQKNQTGRPYQVIRWQQMG
jgi:alpha-D-xyloside xylohydrolase